MNILCYPLGELQANCYFLIEDKEVLIIDPGESADFILEEVSRKNLEVKGIFATHGHFDHVMAAGEIQLATNAPFYIFKEDEFLVKRLESTAKHFLGYTPVVLKPKKFTYLKAGRMNLGNFTFEVLHVPGHTPGSSCYYFEKAQAVFTGDTLFKNAIGRYDFSYSDKNLLKQSLERLFKLPEETTVYSGHEEVTTIGEEKKRNRPYL